MRALCAAGDRLVHRLNVLHKLQMQYQETGQTHIELHIGELCEPADLEAIKVWNAAKAQALGAVPLPMEACQ